MNFPTSNLSTTEQQSRANCARGSSAREIPEQTLLGYDWIPIGLLACASFLLFLTSPREGAFWWSEAPRHALDGVFCRDLVHAVQFQFLALKKFATEYYLHYPALNVLAYPPLFPIIEAALFDVLGTSHAVAQFCIATFTLGAAIGAYSIALRWLDRWHAFAAALLLIGLHEVSFWGRQVMLEIPCLAFLLWSAYLLMRFVDNQKP